MKDDPHNRVPVDDTVYQCGCFWIRSAGSWIRDSEGKVSWVPVLQECFAHAAMKLEAHQDRESQRFNPYPGKWKLELLDSGCGCYWARWVESEYEADKLVQCPLHFAENQIRLASFSRAVGSMQGVRFNVW